MRRETEEVEDFLLHLEKERQVSPNTVSAYRRDLEAFAGFCDRHYGGDGSWDWDSVDRLGLRGTSYCANAINAAVALAALALARRERDARTGIESVSDVAIPTALPRAVTGTVLALSGFCTLGYEILWFRGLRYLVGASSYAFSIVLFTTAAGAGFGVLSLTVLTPARKREGSPAKAVSAAVASA